MDVLAVPRVTNLSGQEGKIETGREFAYMDADGKATTKHLGTKFTLLPKATGEDRIDLHFESHITGFEGFLNKTNGVKQPIFSERKLTANVSINSGQTVVLEFPAHSTKQTNEERSAGRVTTKTENVIRHTMVFVTARLFDSASGKPVDSKLRN